jgi:hypothetical protein
VVVTDLRLPGEYDQRLLENRRLQGNKAEGISMHYVRLGLFVAGVFLASCSKSPPTGATTISGTNTTITGTVVERLEGPPYIYLRLKTENGEKVWVAVPMTTVESGGKVTITHGAALRNFRAPRIGRRFDLVVFGTLERG